MKTLYRVLYILGFIPLAPVAVLGFLFGLIYVTFRAGIYWANLWLTREWF